MNFNNNNIIQDIRNQRNILLFQTDKYLLPDFPITTEQLEQVKEYRNQLRTFPNSSNVLNFTLPTFPEKPNFL